MCRRLDGIPLALELAAVRLRPMSIEQIVARLDDRFLLLGTARSSDDRHQMLRAAIGWSHELGTAQEQRLWARLSVFPGGYDLEAAERVCAGDPLTAGTLFDTLGRLVEKSIVLCEQDGRRYRTLDTIREYGAEQLVLLGEQDELRRRHRDYYLGLAKQATAGSLGPGKVGWLIRLRQETPNLLGQPPERKLGRRVRVRVRVRVRWRPESQASRDTRQAYSYLFRLKWPDGRVSTGECPCPMLGSNQSMTSQTRRIQPRGKELARPVREHREEVTRRDEQRDAAG